MITAITQHLVSWKIPALLGSIALTMFVAVFVTAWIVTMRNRRVIHRHASKETTGGE